MFGNSHKEEPAKNLLRGFETDPPILRFRQVTEGRPRQEVDREVLAKIDLARVAHDPVGAVPHGQLRQVRRKATPQSGVGYGREVSADVIEIGNKLLYGIAEKCYIEYLPIRKLCRKSPHRVGTESQGGRRQLAFQLFFGI